MDKKKIINNTIHFVKKTLKNAESGHDWFHIERVYKNAKLIAQKETADFFIIELAALLHDIADSKFHGGDDNIGAETAKSFLNTQNIDALISKHVVAIIANMSFSKNIDSKASFNSIELQIVQDADRLDAIGAIGIARTFNYGGYKNRTIYNPNIKPNLHMTKKEYKISTAPTINHFQEKLLLLKDKMNTSTGKEIARERHQYMLGFLDQFYAEWNGER